MFLVKKPKVSSFVLTESYFDGVTPLTIRFKLNSGICTDFIQVFIEKVSGSAILNTHYKIRPTAGLSFIQDPVSLDLKGLSILISGKELYYDVYLDPIINFSTFAPKNILFRTRPSKDYLINNSDLNAVFGASRKILLSSTSLIINSATLVETDFLDTDIIEIVDTPEGLSQVEGTINTQSTSTIFNSAPLLSLDLLETGETIVIEDGAIPLLDPTTMISISSEINLI